MNLHQFLRIVEIRTKIVSLSTLTLGFLWTWAAYRHFDWLMAVLLISSALMVDMGTTAFNSFYDYVNGVDAKETNREADKVLVHQKVAPGEALLISIGLYLGAGILGLVISWFAGPIVLVVGIVSLAVGFFYNGGPKPLSATPFGEVFAGGFLGGVLFLLVIYTQKGSLEGQDFLLSLPSTIFIASILTVNNTCDALGDRHAGRFTFSILLGPKLSPILIPFLGLAAYGAACIALALTNKTGPLSNHTIITQIPLVLAAGLSVPGYLSILKQGFNHQTKGSSMGKISKLFILFTLGMMGSLALVILLGMAN